MPETLYVLVAGGGRVGLQTAERLAARGHDVTVVERDGDRCETIADGYFATVVEGDASNPEILEQAGVADADVLGALTGETGLNLAVCMAAQRMADGVRTVARVDRPEGDRYTRFVDAVVFPERAGAAVAANEMVGSDVETLAAVTGTLDVVQVRVAEGAPAAGKELRNVRFPEGTLVVSDDEGRHVARPETTLAPGSRYVVAVEPDVVDEVLNLLRG